MDLKLPVLRKELKQFRKTHPRLGERILALIELAKLSVSQAKPREVDFERAALKSEGGINPRTLKRWAKAYVDGGVRGLMPKKAPGRKARFIRGHTAGKIREYRELYNWGAEVIQAHLEHDHGIKIGRDRIHRFLRKSGLLQKKIVRAKKKKHTRVVKVEHPGTHTQTDVKHLPHLLANGDKCYVYNFVDHASKWSHKRAYDSYGPSETKDFMDRVIAEAPFVITRLQSDNGVEFTNKYLTNADDPKPHALDELCASQGIRHVLIPPGEKELQGLVERSHRQDDEELYHRITPADLAEFNRLLASHCEWRNACRRRKALSWKTSDQFVAEYRKRIQDMLWGDPAPAAEVKPSTPLAEESPDLIELAA